MVGRDLARDGVSLHEGLEALRVTYQRVRGYDVFEAGNRIRRLLPSPRLSMVGPFVLFDHFGPVTLAPFGRSVSRR